MLPAFIAKKVFTDVLMVLWQRVKQQAATWREVALSGLMIIVLVLVVRWIGLLQVQELMAFDTLSRHCPDSAAERSIVIVGIDEADLNAVGGFPIPDQTLVSLLTTLQNYSPAVIGLDLLRDLPLQPGYDLLAQILAQSSNLIGAEMALNSEPRLNVNPPAMLPAKRVGLSISWLITMANCGVWF
ncbi:MAG: CHASE2 domain-containing protein [Leptolyngbyaceae cyanobacterium SM1_1_3]|nr:CHASE2 domain-containing protein [Leptolyngbyaceae cyanobacterium SM1_1_3]